MSDKTANCYVELNSLLVLPTFSFRISVDRVVGRVHAVSQMKLYKHNRSFYHVLQIHCRYEV